MAQFATPRPPRVPALSRTQSHPLPAPVRLVPRAALRPGQRRHTLVAFAIYLRNVLLIQTMLASALIANFALLQMIAPALIWTHLRDGLGPIQIHILAQVLLVALALPIWTALGLLARNADPVIRKYWSAAARICGSTLCVVIWLTLPAYVRSHPSPTDGLWKPALWIAGFFLLEFFVTLFQTVVFKGNARDARRRRTSARLVGPASRGDRRGNIRRGAHCGLSHLAPPQPRDSGIHALRCSRSARASVSHFADLVRPGRSVRRRFS